MSKLIDFIKKFTIKNIKINGKQDSITIEPKPVLPIKPIKPIGPINIDPTNPVPVPQDPTIKDK